MKKPFLLCILDGCGIAPKGDYNAFDNAYKPTFNKIMEEFPHTILEASGQPVGLPKGQMGTSEVGHMNIGAGRICYQSLEMINRSIESGEFYKNENILKVINHTKENNSKLHIMGLISDGGIHSHTSHLLAIVDMCKQQGIKEIYFHLFTDGRDTGIHTAQEWIKKLEDKIDETSLGTITTISGRYYAMDRDNNYDRLKLAYDAICYGIGEEYNSVKECIEDQYSKDITDEFIKPSIISDGKLSDNDGIIVWNYRPDRLREMFTAITNPDEVPMETTKYNNIKFVSMMPINDTVKGLTAFEHQDINNGIGEYLANLGYSQLRIAETEKYVHVTHFFDGDKDIELPNAKKILIPSPKVATYDLKPSMSAEEVTTSLLEELDKDYLDFIVLNFANGDMVGHTGVYEAAKEAVEFMDTCLEKIYKKIQEKEGTMIITADHGNCDVMMNEDGTVCTTHTTNPVPFVVTRKGFELKERGKLADIAPTILTLMDLPIPVEISGDSLIK